MLHVLHVFLHVFLHVSLCLHLLLPIPPVDAVILVSSITSIAFFLVVALVVALIIIAVLCLRSKRASSKVFREFRVERFVTVLERPYKQCQKHQHLYL